MPDGMSGGPLLLIVEDDADFSRTLRRAFERRGYEALVADSLEQMQEILKTHSPSHAVVDLKLGGASGLACVEALHAHDPGMLIVVLTGSASIGTAVEAINPGACHFLATPSHMGEIESAFNKLGTALWSERGLP